MFSITVTGVVLPFFTSRNLQIHENSYSEYLVIFKIFKTIFHEYRFKMYRLLDLIFLISKLL
jgi:hypothetical protein